MTRARQLFAIGFVFALSATARASQFGDFTYEVDGAAITITDYPESATGDVVIPSEIESLPVTTIGFGAFRNCRGVTGFTIPDSVTAIGDEAFERCSALVAISIPSSVLTIGGSAFFRCGALADVTFAEGVTEIGDRAFLECEALRSLELPASLRTLGSYAFGFCSGLTTLVIAPGLTTMGLSTFRGCKQLIEIVLPPTVTSIASFSFADCFSLERATVPASLQVVPKFLFSNCVALREVEIEEGIASIHQGAFSDCSALRRIELPSTLTQIVADAFEGCASLVGIEIPAAVTEIGSSAFRDCDALGAAIFSGDAPDLALRAFDRVAPSFTFYFCSGGAGFTTPTWEGFPAMEIDAAADPAAKWLVGYGFPPDADLGGDPVGDGVSLLMAYALDLDPGVNLRSRLPGPVVTADSVEMSFYGASPGVTYAVEMSKDLQAWTTAGVDLSAPDAAGMRTASIALGGRCFLRLVVAEN